MLVAEGWSWSPGHDCGFLLPLESRDGTGTSQFSLWRLGTSVDQNPRKHVLGFVWSLMAISTASLLYSVGFLGAKAEVTSLFHSDLNKKKLRFYTVA